MKIVRLGLQPYGAYRETTPLEFDTTKRLHVVYGLNESGKTTRRSAITDLLFGFEHQTRYAFAYEMNVLRLYATIEVEGTRHEVERRKGRADTLRDVNGVPIHEDISRAWTGGTDRSMFCNRFAFGSEELSAGAELLLSSGGDLGYSLYGAALGGADARSLLSEFDHEAEGLFKPGGRTVRINAAITKYSAAAKRVRELSHRPDEYLDLESSRERISARLTELDGEQGFADQRLTRVAAIVNAIAVHETYRQLELQVADAAARGGVIPDAALDELGLTVERERQLATAWDVARDVCERVDHEPLVGDPAILSAASEIDALAADLNAITKALEDIRSNRIEEMATRNGNRYRMLSERYWPGVDDGELRAREPQREMVSRAQKLANRFGSIQTEAADANRALDGILAEQHRIKVDRDGVASPKDVTALAAAASSAQTLGDIDARIAVAEAGIRARRQRLEDRVTALALVNANAADLAMRKLPLFDDVELAVTTASTLLHRHAVLTAEEERLTIALESAEAVVETHAAAGELGSGAGLQALRVERTACFDAVDEAWRGGERYQAELSAKYRRAAGQADDFSDHRYIRAETLARAERAVSDRDAALAARDDVLIKVQRLSADRLEFEAYWRSLWAAVNIEPLAPTSMRTWLAQTKVLLAEYEALRDEEVALTELQARRADRHTALCHELDLVGRLDAHDANRDLETLIARASEFIGRMEALARLRKNVDENLERVRSAHAAALLRQVQARTALERWSTEWQAALEALALPPKTEPDSIGAIVEDIRELFAAFAAYRNDQARLDGIRRAEMHYRLRTTELVAKVAADLLSMVSQSVPMTVESLAARLAAARNTAAKQVERADHARRAEADFLRVSNELQSVRRRLDALLEPLQIPIDGLTARIEASFELRRLRTERDQRARELSLSVRCSIDEVDAEVSQYGYDGLRVEQLRLRDVLGTLKEERESLITERRDVSVKLASIEGSDAAAQAQGDLLAIGGEIDRNARRYAAIIVARTLLEDEVSRYAKTHQAPILTAASSYFSSLTFGRYTWVQVVAGDNRPTIEVVCADGQRTVDQLSDGTRDQLYLALRLAALEEYLRSARALPLVVDDVLLNFDDTRTRAALVVLQTFAAITQVIYFTHHRRVVDLAQDALGDTVDIVELEELSGLRGVTTADP